MNETALNRARDALELAKGIYRRWESFADLDTEQWHELNIEAERLEKTDGSYSLDPKTRAAGTLLLFMDILEEIIST